MTNKTPHIKLIAFKNDDVPANAPQYSMKKYKVEEDIHIKAGEYDVDVFENVSSNGKAYLSVLLKDVWVKDNPSPVAEEGSETDF